MPIYTIVYRADFELPYAYVTLEDAVKKLDDCIEKEYEHFKRKGTKITKEQVEKEYSIRKIAENEEDYNYYRYVILLHAEKEN